MSRVDDDRESRNGRGRRRGGLDRRGFHGPAHLDHDPIGAGQRIRACRQARLAEDDRRRVPLEADGGNQRIVEPPFREARQHGRPWRFDLPSPIRSPRRSLERPVREKCGPASGDGGRTDRSAPALELIRANRELIDRHRPKTPFNRCGYLLHDVLTDDGLDLAKLLVGSEGTLAFVTAASLRRCPALLAPPATSWCPSPVIVRTPVVVSRETAKPSARAASPTLKSLPATAIG